MVQKIVDRGDRMKKQYSKPGIIIEDFAIAQNIALNCGNAGGNKHTHADGLECAWKEQNITVFAEGNIRCLIQLSPGERYEDICYHNPSGKFSVFGS